jgi:hypothetical protein
MTITTMLDYLGVLANELNRAQDAPFEFTPTERLLVLNQQQDYVIGALNDGIITTLDYSDAAVALNSTDGHFHTTDLTKTLFRGVTGIRGILHSSLDKFCVRVSFRKHRIMTMMGAKGTSDIPVYYQQGTSFFVYPYSGATVTVYYQREPVAMTTSVNCELETFAQDIIMDLASWRLCLIGNDLRRAEIYKGQADAAITKLNAEFPVDESSRMGYRANLGTNPFGGGNGNYNIYLGS